MYGVVLWSDENKNCAVIWCEDHRKLAYFKDEEAAAEQPMTFNPGDLIEFDIHEYDDMRLALDPSLVCAQHYPTLAEDLIASQSKDRKATSLPKTTQETGQVVAFRTRSDTPVIFDELAQCACG